MLNKSDVENCLKEYIVPYLGQDLLSAGALKEIIIGSGISLRIVLGFPLEEELQHKIKQEIIQLLTKNFALDVSVACSFRIREHKIASSIKLHPKIKNIIAVASGKGGVGKSTTAVNLALALSLAGARVGILDADIYGPSQPKMLGVKGKVEVNENKTFEPLRAYGLQSMSIGYLIDEATPMVWRGPMVSNALQQLINNTNWDDLDYLIVDLPPGTGDIQLTLAQKIPVTAAVIVTTPQDLALIDAKKAIGMFASVKVPVLGVIENMSMHKCSTCGHVEHIFGVGGGQELAREYTIPLLGSLPLDVKIREQADGGMPTVIAEPNSYIANCYRDVARNMVAKLSLTARSSYVMSAVVIE